MAVIHKVSARTYVETAPAVGTRRRWPAISFVVVNVLLLVGVLVEVLPYLYMAFSAFKNNAEIFGVPLTLWPRTWTFTNMTQLFQGFPVARWMLNTAIVAVVGTFLAVMLASLAGYAFAKHDFRFKNPLLFMMLATILLPSQVLLVPQFQIMRTLDWFNTYEGLIIPRAVTAFGIILMRQYTLSIPNELLDAARVDGASEFGIWWRIVVPLVRPGLAVLGILTFLGLWNDYFWPLIITTDPKMFVMNLGISSLIGPYDFRYGMLLSGALLASLPVILVFIFFQKQFVAGLTRGALK
ncbi:carbohydrate ABC transporter permease [Actinopolymorpha singaporensis]|uniref:Carbohydrate ABC transporter membrane protein 2, CUT1 family n=1 Tax=Actinopolymorpha singaporensis TaxID=117157 RepID=A0A1H1RUW0_9ACTN|nr:carbohydrate ABC transporter permease [Actinopolymorpha singaporensis]SDS39502.1 carbohydrate ABC transporter membrane protein 2, CUT1 family [Actinopolymorpha singaporensis]